MIKWVRTLAMVLLAVAPAEAQTPATPPTCNLVDAACPLPTEWAAEPSNHLVFATSKALISFDEIARAVAPILWFSPDEPMIVTRKAAIPQPLPCDTATRASGTPRAVYYRISHVFSDPQLSGARLAGMRTVRQLLYRDEKLVLSGLRYVRVKLFFYYDKDYGFEDHDDDLERVDVVIRIAHKNGCHFGFLSRYDGAAHGSEFQANLLSVDGTAAAADVRLPLTVLVEEGKHASCPDRNGDGQYTPGYDVNTRVSDAWGVRDIFASGDVAAAYYNAGMTKFRRDSEGYRIVPQCAAAAAADPSKWPVSYALVSARQIPICPTTAFLQTQMIKQKFNALPEELRGEPIAPKPTESLFVGPRYDGGPGGQVTTLFGTLPKLGGWIGLRSAATYSLERRRLRGGLDIVYAPSISRWIDWYGGVGIQVEDFIQAAYEFGVQLRLRQWGLRVGVRNRFGTAESALHHSIGQRVIAEAGYGPW
jgi:hypothetical protein